MCRVASLFDYTVSVHNTLRVIIVLSDSSWTPCNYLSLPLFFFSPCCNLHNPYSSVIRLWLRNFQKTFVSIALNLWMTWQCQKGYSFFASFSSKWELHCDVLSWEASLPLFVAMLSLPDVAVRGTDRKVAPLILHIICCTLLVSLASDWKLSIGKTRGFAKEPSWRCKALLFTTPPRETKKRRWNTNGGGRKRWDKNAKARRKMART